MLTDACIAAVRTASGDALSETEATDLIRLMERRRAALEAEGKLDGLDQRMAQLAAEGAEEARLAAALARKHAALNAITRDRLDRQLTGLLDAGVSYRSAFLAVFHGIARNAPGARKSVQATQLAYEKAWLGGLRASIEEERPHIAKLLRDRKFNDDVAREMQELREGGQPGITRNNDAQWAAKKLADSAESARQELNRLGANIGRIDGWSGPQMHDQAKILRSTQQDWVTAILPKLDLEKTFPGLSREEAAAALGDIWTTIATGRDRSITARQKGEFVGPANLAKSLGKHRELHFKSADDWLAYRDQYGSGTTFSAMVNHLQKSARMAGAMQVMGPNPEIMTGSLLESATLAVRNSDMPAKEKAKTIAQLQSEGTAISNALDEVRGFTLAPVSVGMSRVFGGIRGVQSMAKLGGALLSSVSDMVTRAVGLTYQGKPILQTWQDMATDMVGSVGDKEARKRAYLLGEGFDGWIDHINSAYVAEDSVPGGIHRAMSTFFRLSGLTAWTDMQRAGQARLLSAWMGEQAGAKWDRLPKDYRNVLSQQGITPEKWELIRKTAYKAENGNTYISPDRIGAIEGMDPKARLELELDVRRFFADEVGFGVLGSDSAVRRLMLQGTRPGTGAGELLRTLGQFRGFPVAYTQRVLGRLFLGGEGDTVTDRLWNQSGNIAHMLVGLSLVGYLSMTLKDLAAGRTPRDPMRPKTLIAAMLQSGGLGIYGDFLFAESNRFGASTLQTLAGPTVGTAAQVVDLWIKARDGDAKAGQALNLVVSNTPFANLFYAKPVMDVLFLNSMRESLSPGFLARQERDRYKDFGQTHFMPRTL